MERIRKIIAGVLMLFCLSQSVMAIGAIQLEGSGGLLGGLGVCLVAFGKSGLWAFCAAAIGVYVFLPDLTQNWVDALFFPSRKLKVAPVILSPLRAAMERREYAFVAGQLEELLTRQPDAPALWLLKFELETRQEEDLKALKTAEAFFARPKRILTPENYTLLLAYADLAENLGLPGAARNAIAAELANHPECYTSGDRSRLRSRLDGVQQTPWQAR